MKLTLEQMKAVTVGIEDIHYENGVFSFHRFTENEKNFIDNHNVIHPAGVKMEFKTDAKLLKIKGLTRQFLGSRSYYAFDIFENDIKIGSIQNLKDEDACGNYAYETYALGEFSESFCLSDGEKNIKIVFPYSIVAEIEEIELADASFISPVKQDKNIIFYGDSITQGYDALHPSKTYAYRLSEALKANMINKALGGDHFSPSLVKAVRDYKPEYVIVAYGTNDWSYDEKEDIIRNAAAFLDTAVEKFPDSKIYVLSPIWRKDFTEYRKAGEFKEIEIIIKKACENRKNVCFISGFSLVPGDENLFGDLRLHPSDKGFEHYFINLLDKMRKSPNKAE